jgi:hypothetical protein
MAEFHRLLNDFRKHRTMEQNKEEKDKLIDEIRDLRGDVNGKMSYFKEEMEGRFIRALRVIQAQQTNGKQSWQQAAAVLKFEVIYWAKKRQLFQKFNITAMYI